jgi:hypothetical protein
MSFVDLVELEQQTAEAKEILKQIQQVVDTALPQPKRSLITRTRATKTLPDTEDVTGRQSATLLLPVLMEIIRPGFDIGIYPMKSTATLSFRCLSCSSDEADFPKGLHRDGV